MPKGAGERFDTEDLNSGRRSNRRLARDDQSIDPNRGRLAKAQTELANPPDLTAKPHFPNRRTMFGQRLVQSRRRNCQRDGKITCGIGETDTTDHVDIDIALAKPDSGAFFQYRNDQVQTAQIKPRCGATRQTE